jgi:two-component system response regulator FixJ
MATDRLDWAMPGNEKTPMAQSAPAQRAVYVIDDDVDVRKSLHFLLTSSSMMAWPFASADEFIDLLPNLAPAPILVDIRMAGTDGLQMLRILKARAVAWPIIVMTAHADVAMAVNAMKLGAIEFLEKPFEAAALIDILDQAFCELDQLRQAWVARNDARLLIGQLSRRESDVLTILMQGTLNKVAAHQLGLSPRTVEMHRGNALAKLGLKSMVEVVALFATADLPNTPHTASDKTP